MKYYYTMQSNLKCVLTIVVCLFATVIITAQGTTNSPYSRFGLGDLADNNLIHLRSMGGIAGAYQDAYHANISNPASYASLQATTFDIGISALYSRLSENDFTEGRWSGNLEYLSIAIPLYNPINNLLEQEESKYHIATAFNLVPFSTVNYDITSFEQNPDVGELERNFNGNGGSYKFMWGNSIGFKNIAFGINVGYLFGNIQYQRNLLFNDQVNALSDEFDNEYSMKGFVYDAGLIYSHYFVSDDNKEKKRAPDQLNIGIYGNIGTSFSTNSTVLNRSILRFGNSIVSSDTSFFEANVEGNGKLPSKLGVGMMYYKGNKYAMGFDFHMENWSSYENDANPRELSTTYRIGAGGYLRPDYNSFTSFFKRVYYRYGIYYGKDPRSFDDKQLSTYGLTFGMGLPFVFQRKISHANLGLELGSRGSGSPLSETFVKLSLSVTFNDDEWFIKRKYN